MSKLIVIKTKGNATTAVAPEMISHVRGAGRHFTVYLREGSGKLDFYPANDDKEGEGLTVREFIEMWVGARA